MYIGASTQDALCYFQAGAGLPETGFVDADTWKALLGPERFGWGPVPGAIGLRPGGVSIRFVGGEEKNDARRTRKGPRRRVSRRRSSPRRTGARR